MSVDTQRRLEDLTYSNEPHHTRQPPISTQLAQSPSESTPLENKTTTAVAASAELHRDLQRRQRGGALGISLVLTGGEDGL